MPDIRVGEAFEQFYEKPFIRKILKRLPESAMEAEPPPPYGFVIGLDLEGNVVHNLQDMTGTFHHLTNAIEIGGSLYLGSLRMESVGKYILQLE